MKRTLQRLWLRVEPLWQFAQRQGVRLAAFSASYFRVGEICFGVVFVSLCLHWFNPVTTPAFNAWNFPFWAPARLWPRFFTPMGYGIPATMLCVLGYFGWRLRKSWMVLGASWLLLLLGLTFFLQVTCWEPTWLRASVDGGTDFDRFYTFEVATNIPHGVVGDPAGDLPAPVYGLLTRIGVGISTLSSGWYFFMGGAILCLVAGLAHCRDWRELRGVAWLGTVLTFLVIGVQLWRPVQGELQVEMAANAANRGELDDAINHYRRAIAVDKWNRLRPDLYEAIGSLFEVTGQKDRPEYHLYLAARFEATDVLRALFELEQAATGADPELAEIIRKKIGRLTQSYGKALYAQGRLGAARRQMELSLATVPEEVAGYYMAGSICYANSDYNAGIEYLSKGLNRTRQPVLIANLRCGLGDCYYKLGDIGTARSYYQASRLANDFENYRALKSLTADYYR
jgi:hypothetical protein